MSTESFYLSRVEPPVWFRAPSTVTEAEITCKVCGENVLPGELVAEVDDEFGQQFVHEACVGEDERQ